MLLFYFCDFLHYYLSSHYVFTSIRPSIHLYSHTSADIFLYVLYLSIYLFTLPHCLFLILILLRLIVSSIHLYLSERVNVYVCVCVWARTCAGVCACVRFSYILSLSLPLFEWIMDERERTLYSCRFIVGEIKDPEMLTDKGRKQKKIPT